MSKTVSAKYLAPGDVFYEENGTSHKVNWVRLIENAENSVAVMTHKGIILLYPQYQQVPLTPSRPESVTIPGSVIGGLGLYNNTSTDDTTDLVTIHVIGADGETRGRGRSIAVSALRKALDDMYGEAE